MSQPKPKKRSSLHTEMLALLKEAPRMFLAARLQKLIDSKVPDAPFGFAQAFAEHLITNGDAPFLFDDGEEGGIDFEISEEEMQGVIDDAWRFIDEEVPQIIDGSISASAKAVLKSLRNDWPAQRAFQLDTMAGFRTRLEERWGSAFDILRMMYTIAHEMGAEVHMRARRSRAKTNLILRDTLIQLHVRACQVVAEILCLMENGFADGAMARWRTLHEIVTVAGMIAKHGDTLAERYRVHEAVEAKRAMDRFVANHEALGFTAPSQREIDQTEQAYQNALSLYGHNFGSEYGWAAHHLQLKKPRLSDLEASVGKREMRSYYVLASYNVHASPKGLASRLGILRGPGMPVGLAGSSNVGFVEPAQHAAFDLAYITSLIFLPRVKIDDALQIKVLVLLRDQIAGKLRAAHRDVAKAHRAELKRRQAAGATTARQGPRRSPTAPA